MTSIDVLVPTKPAEPTAPFPLAERRAPAAGAHLTLISNGKSNARELLLSFADELREALGVGEVEVVIKPAASSTLPPEQAQAIADRSDLVIAGLGDCGACSACSLHDAAQLERLGVPTSVIITDVFQGTAAGVVRTLGIPGYQAVVVPHPVSSRDADQLRRMAADAAPVALRQLTPATAAVAV